MADNLDVAKLHQKLSDAIQDLAVPEKVKKAIDEVFAEAQTGKTAAERAKEASDKAAADKVAADKATTDKATTDKGQTLNVTAASTKK